MTKKNTLAAASQAEDRKKIAQRLPSWAVVDHLQIPSRLSLEQCSSEATARYKAEVAKRLFPEGGDTLIDLTGGLGVDFSHLAPLFRKAIYTEQRPELCEAMRHNAPLLGLGNIEIREADSTAILSELPAADLIFIDPARRDAAGHKTVRIEDCEPDLTRLLPLLLEKAKTLLVKLSPMLDITQAIERLSCVAEVHIIDSDRECKELLLVITNGEKTPTLTCASLPHGGEGETRRFSFTMEEEAQAAVTLTHTPKTFLYEPSPAMMKGGAFRLVAQRFGLEKLHRHSHLYTGDKWLPDFPGRGFRVMRTSGFGKRALRDFKGDLQQANLATRNFPGSVAELRKRLKLKDGGNEYWFATTLADESHVLIACEKVVQAD